jgi:aspartate carbamoyltransferase regulatory subunit
MSENQNQNKTLLVNAIKNGTVIDHMSAGSAIKVLELFNLVDIDKDKEILTQATVGINLKCKNGRFKDILKLEDRVLTEQELANIAVFSPKASINIIDNYEVIKKFKVKMPKKLHGVLKCKNNSCISNKENINTRFDVLENLSSDSSYSCKLRCVYCDCTFDRVF